MQEFASEGVLSVIDLHCHILPGVDDGAGSMDDACRMARLAAESGISVIVATPHCNIPGQQPNTRSAALNQRFAELNRQLRLQGIDIQVLPGAEVFARDNLFTLLQERKLNTINNSRYLLVEFYFGESASTISSALLQVRQAGLIPIVAHPERYEAVQHDPGLAVGWFRDGYIIQLNKGSLLGRLGRGAKHCGLWLLDHGFAHVIASDAHSPEYRTPYMTNLVNFLLDYYPAAYVNLLLEKNPQRIIENRSIPIPRND